MSDNKPVLLCISSEVDLQTGKTREVSRLYGNASGMVRDVQTAERNADRLAAMRETDGAKPFDLTADQFAAVSAYYAACRQPTPNAEGVRVGDIFYNVWGYDQTNVDFYQARFPARRAYRRHSPFAWSGCRRGQHVRQGRPRPQQFQGR